MLWLSTLRHWPRGRLLATACTHTTRVWNIITVCSCWTTSPQCQRRIRYQWMWNEISSDRPQQQWRLYCNVYLSGQIHWCRLSRVSNGQRKLSPPVSASTNPTSYMKLSPLPVLTPLQTQATWGWAIPVQPHCKHKLHEAEPSQYNPTANTSYMKLSHPSTTPLQTQATCLQVYSNQMYVHLIRSNIHSYASLMYTLLQETLFLSHTHLHAHVRNVL